MPKKSTKSAQQQQQEAKEKKEQEKANKKAEKKARLAAERKLYMDQLEKIMNEQTSLKEKVIKQLDENSDTQQAYRNNVSLNPVELLVIDGDLSLSRDVAKEIDDLKDKFVDTLKEMKRKKLFLDDPEEKAFLLELALNNDFLTVVKGTLLSSAKDVAKVKAETSVRALGQTVRLAWGGLEKPASLTELTSDAIREMKVAFQTLDKINRELNGIDRLINECDLEVSALKAQVSAWKSSFEKKLAERIAGYHEAMKTRVQNQMLYIEKIFQMKPPKEAVRQCFWEANDCLTKAEELHQLEALAKNDKFKLKHSMDESAGWIAQLQEKSQDLVKLGNSIEPAPEPRFLPLSNFKEDVQQNNQIIPFDLPQAMGTLNLNQTNQNSIHPNTINGANESDEEKNLNTIKFSH